MSVIIFDVDGVLADFTKAFTTLGNQLFGTPIVDNHEQPDWNFRDSLTAAQQDHMWNELKAIPEWWASLNSLIPRRTFRRIDMLTLYHEVYFVTHRMHSMRPAGEQTVTWLLQHGIDNPRVIVSGRKGEIASALGADFAIEDNWGNACAIHWMADKCQTFLINRRYNEKAREIIPERITRVDTVEQFLTEIEGE